MSKLRFVGTFLVVFALLLVVWKVTQGSRWYTEGMLLCAGLVGPALHGWVLQAPRAGETLPVWIHGDQQVKASLQFDALSIGVVPVVALLAATPRLTPRRRAVLILVGTA